MERNILQFANSIGDGVQFVTKWDVLHVQCYSDWCSDSETGYGAEVGFDLTREQAKEVCDFIMAWLGPDSSTINEPAEMRELLAEWMKFSADVQPGCAAGADWLDRLRNMTGKHLLLYRE